MGKIVRLSESDLNRIVKKTIVEMGGDMKNTHEQYEFKMNRIKKGLYELIDSIDRDPETAKHIAQVILYSLDDLDSYVQEMKK